MGKRKPSGYWQNEDNFEREMGKAIEKNRGQFPDTSSLSKRGREDLINAMNKYYGGINSVRQKMGYEQEVQGYWEDWGKMERELKGIIKNNNDEFPTQELLVKIGPVGMLSTINRCYGGLKKVREKFGYEQLQKPKGYWHDWQNFEREIRLAIEKNEGSFPTLAEIREMGNHGLINAMRIHGGVNTVRKKMDYETKKKSYGYYGNWENFEREMREAIEENGGVFPTQNELVKINGSLPSAASKRYGGLAVVREKMGYDLNEKSHGYWRNWENFEREMRKAIETNGGEFPSSRVLKKMGLTSLSNAITSHHSGFRKVRERMGVDQVRKPAGYWEDWENFEIEMKKAIEKNEGEFPSSNALKKTGMRYLIGPMSIYGGANTVRQKMGFSIVRERKGSWQDLEFTLERALTFIQENGCENLPSSSKVSKVKGYSSLSFAINKYHGGFVKFRDLLRERLNRPDSQTQLESLLESYVAGGL